MPKCLKLFSGIFFLFGPQQLSGDVGITHIQVSFLLLGLVVVYQRDSG